VNRASGPLPDVPREDSGLVRLQRPRVKFCGITRREDAVAAADLGVDAVGFVLWSESPRYVAIEAARELVRAVPADMETVALFVGADHQQVVEAADYIGVSAVQVYRGEFDDSQPRRQLRIVPVSFSDSDSSTRVCETAGLYPDDVVLLVDAHDPKRLGGTGQPAHWGSAESLAEMRPIILAGGLTAKNVIEAIHWITPFALDVSSGIESSPGIKDRAKMREFLWTAEYAWSCLGRHFDIEWRRRVQFRGAEPRGLRNIAGLEPKVTW
jgi:phosphoribosylanthranilate isomerase